MSSPVAASAQFVSNKKRPISSPDWDDIRRRLTSNDNNDALSAAKKLKDCVELLRNNKPSELPISTLLPAISTVLLVNTNPTPEIFSQEHTLRNTCMEILSRLPHDDEFKHHAPALLDISMQVLAKDFEDNALLASKIIFDMHKKFRLMPQGQVQPYLDFVQTAYRSLPASVQQNFRFEVQKQSQLDPALPEGKRPSKDSSANLSTICDIGTPDNTITSPPRDDFLKSIAESPGFGASPSTVSTGSSSTPKPRLALKSTSSFRVLTEFPLTVMLLFQLYPKFKTNIPTLIQLMIEALAIRAPPIQSLVTPGVKSSFGKIESSLKRSYYTRSRELVAAQVKTLSFLTYLLRGFSDQMKPYEDRIASNVVSLMKDCPRESIGTRKELLVATRHILATDFRKGFFRYIDSLLDERILIGCHNHHSDQLTTLQPLGYSTLADLVQHVRSMLSLKQLSRVIYIFSRVIHDSSMTLPLAIQLTGVRLLLNLVDTIFHNKDPNPQVGRDLLDRIFDTLVDKLGTLRDKIAKVQVAECESNTLQKNETDDSARHEQAAPKVRIDEHSEIGVSPSIPREVSEITKSDAKDQANESMPKIQPEQPTREVISADSWMLDGAKGADSLIDLQSIVRSIVVGLKTVVWCISNYRQPKEKETPRDSAAEDNTQPTIRMTKFEREILEKYIDNVLPCISLFSSEDDTQQQQGDVLTYFAASFAVIDSYNLRCTMGKKIGILVETIIKDRKAMVIPRHLLGSNRSTSLVFCDILLRYLSRNLESLMIPKSVGFVFLSQDSIGYDRKDCENIKHRGRRLLHEVEAKSSQEGKKYEKIASTHLELFERVMKSVTSFADNEVALRPYLQDIVASSLRMSMEKGDDWPDKYCLLLRCIFRSLSAGKFEGSYKELLPMIPNILNGLYRIYEATDDEFLGYIIVELCLTIPARLSSLLPHMPLLLRMIISSLNTDKGDVVNLGLRTLEFWIDNLNPDFLYPILAKQTRTCTELMEALTRHLRPAPYPYGLLAMRVLGKLGGKNRRFLVDSIPLTTSRSQPILTDLLISCRWAFDNPARQKEFLSKYASNAQKPQTHIPLKSTLSIPMPVFSAVKVLKMAALVETYNFDMEQERKSNNKFKCTLRKVSRENPDALWSDSPDTIDLVSYCKDVVTDTVSSQASDALNIIRSSLSTVLDLGEVPPDLSALQIVANPAQRDLSAESSINSSATFNKRTKCLKSMIKGLLYALNVSKVEEDARICLNGLFHYVFGILHSWSDSIVRIDANGSRVPMFDKMPTRDFVFSEDMVDEPKKQGSSPTNNDLGSLKPFGYFDLTGPFRSINPLVLTEALAEIIGVQSSTIQTTAIEFLKKVLADTVKVVEISPSITTVRQMSTGQIAFYESLLEALCRQLVTTSWNISSGLRTSISLLIDMLGLTWAKKYEVELIHVAITCLKNAPREVPYASVDAFCFFIDISVSLYGKPACWKSNDFIPDLSTMRPAEDGKIEGDKEEGEDQKKEGFTLPSDSVINMLIIELASTKHIVRLAARCTLRNHFFDKVTLTEGEKRLSLHMATIKRVLFTRSLRLLPLPEQVAVIEALTALVDFVPSMLPVSDQHLLAFLSEFLKLSSIADGEMSDANIVGFVVDKNGFCGKTKSSIYSDSSKHMSRIFLRRVCIARICDDSYAVIPEEACYGIQLRVSALRLFNTVISRHSDGFFDADTTTPIGNIRPHVISLLFRSLVSEPSMSVSAAHQALQDVLSLSVVTKEDGEGTNKSQSRLPKELLQTCIRPVLLNLRDYTRLSVSLLRGLERLLSLLSSWFNKTLGEKLLEHLQKWTEPELIKACNIWKAGDEPIVAAGILNLFSLLPHASHFVEPLVKTVIKLEAVLNRFKGHEEGSPYRKPLARYLNKQSQYTVSFFFQRLRTPMYSELFQHVVALEESETLRSYLSGRQCSVNLLNVCFERPLAIIRSEKTSASKAPTKQSNGTSASVAEIMSIHGIALNAGMQREAVFRHEIDSKQKKLATLQQEVTRAKEALKGILTNAADGKELDDAKKRQKIAQAAFEKCQKDLNEKKLMYATEMGRPESSESASKTKKMTTDALELQYQGFQLVETLAKFKKKYLPEHNDIVRAFRWLWRSKGRHLRLQNEEAMPLRFQTESKLLGSLLVEYASACPSDVDVLFELLRIFLQATTRDFGFIRVFLADTVSNVLSLNKKKHIIERFFALLAGEGPEETKVLSIQLIVLPMLLNTLKPRSEFQNSNANGEESKDHEPLAEKAITESLVDQATVDNFIQKVLLKNGVSTLYGERLRVELLRVSTLFIKCLPELMAKQRDDVLQFSWSLLKSENTSCKNWAYLNVCHYIARFDTPTNLIIQTYMSLIRVHQLEGKGYIRSALLILLPCLQSKLDERELRSLVESTIGIICEEGNNIPQVAHVWQTIVAHPNIFIEHRSSFMGHMVNSLTRIGLPPSCPIENRSLSLSIAELVLDWNELPRREPNSTDNVAESSDDREKKRLKAEDGNAVRIGGEISRRLDKSMIDTLGNFLVRMEILLADTKVETSTKNLQEKTLHLLSRVLKAWQSCVIFPLYFEKVISMCVEETATNKTASWESQDKRLREKTTSRITSKSSSSKSRDDSKTVSSALLLACLEVFTALVVEAPKNSFIIDNAQVIKEILEPCFAKARHVDSILMRKKLKRFVVQLIKSNFGNLGYADVVQHSMVLLETFLNVDLWGDNATTRTESLLETDSARREDRRTKEQLKSSSESEKLCGSHISFFSLDIIMEISVFYPQFVRSFSGTLVALAKTLVGSHLEDITSLLRQGGMTSLAGRVSSQRNKQVTSTCGIMEEACIVCDKTLDTQKLGEMRDFRVGWLRVSDVSTSVRSVVTCLKLISLSEIPLYFSAARSSFMKILGSILDNSDNIILLLSATGIVGNWLALKGGCSPLAYKEKVVFLRKLSALDCRPLSPIVSQLLSDLVGSIVLSVANQGISQVFPERDQPIKGANITELEAERSVHCFETTQKMFRRLLVTCLLNSNRIVRRGALLLLIMRADNLQDAVRLANSGNIEKVLSGRPLFDVLWQLLSSDYEGVSGRFWPVIFVEMLAYGCLPTFGMSAKKAWMPKPHAPCWDGTKDSSIQKTVNLFFKHIRDCSLGTHSRRKGVLLEIVSLAHSDACLAQMLFESLMTAAWDELGNDISRSHLIEPIEKLLSRPYHAQKFSDTSEVSNSVQSFLRTCRQMVPQPVLSPDLLVSLAETYGSWHEAISLLENASKALTSYDSTEAFSSKVASGIRYCIEKLGEKNLALFYSQERSLQPETKYVTSLDVHDMVKEAISGYTKLVDIAENPGNDSLLATDLEMDTWEDRWVHLQKEMCQLQVVSDYANAKENCLLQIETAWKSQDWEKVENLIKSESMIAMCERGDPALKMNEILLAIMRGKLTEVENLHAQTAQLCLQKWQLMPDVATGSNCHSSLLHFFHRLVEFRESGQIMVETMKHSNRRTLPDLQNLLTAWRHRLPNNFDTISDWDDIITWRSHMFGSITSNFKWTSEAGTLSTLHDRPWTVIKMAKTARKQGLREVATLALSGITDCSLDVSDAFSKLREQILTFYNPDSDLERTGGLNLVNTTNLSFFDASQKSELFRLKALFLSSLGGRSKANQAYCHAVQVCQSYARAWVSWGGLCLSLGRLAEKQQNEQKQADSTEKENPNAKKIAQYLAQAMGCYLEAIQCDTDEWCRIHLPKCLWMLAKDGATPGVLSQTLETRGAVLPCWVWLPWCPQLLTSLYRIEGKAVKTILTTLAKAYPQALYFPLRAFYLERRDVERSKGSPSPGTHQGSVLFSEELMSSLRRAHASLWSSLEAILEELIVKFRPSYEEELLSTMTALLDRAETQIENSLHLLNDNIDDEEAVVASISKTLGRISTKFFRESQTDANPIKRDERARKTETFKKKYKAMFEVDFLSLTTKTEGKPKIGIIDFLARLRKWKKMLNKCVSSSPTELPLIESSLPLALFVTEAPDLWPMSCDPKAASLLFEKERKKEEKTGLSSTSSSALAAKTAAITAAIALANSEANEGCGGEYGGGSSSIEIPGQYAPNSVSAVDCKPSPELHAKLVRFEPRVKIIRRNDQLIRRVGMIGSDGRCYHFLLQFAIPYWTRTDERTVQMSYIFDKILRKDIVCSRNFLSKQPSPVIPIAQRLRMTYEDKSRFSLDEVFRKRCEDVGCSPNIVVRYYQSRIRKVVDAQKNENMSEGERKEMVASANIQVLKEISTTKVDCNILLNHVKDRLGSAEALFHFRRTFSSQLALDSLMQYVFAAVVRNPPRVVINELTGQVFSPEFRLSYNNQGFLENQNVPFRMTPNLRELIGPIMMGGRFVPSISMAASSLKSNTEDLDAILRLLVRDDIIAWYTSKSMAKSDKKTQELEKQLMDRVSKNVAMIQSKIAECSVKKISKEVATLPSEPVNHRVQELLEEASGYEKLSTMETSFQPWL